MSLKIIMNIKKNKCLKPDKKIVNYLKWGGENKPWYYLLLIRTNTDNFKMANVQ